MCHLLRSLDGTFKHSFLKLEGDLRHFGGKEGHYAFSTPEKLIADFQRDIARWNNENSHT